MNTTQPSPAENAEKPYAHLEGFYPEEEIALLRAVHTNPVATWDNTAEVVGIWQDSDRPFRLIACGAKVWYKPEGNALTFNGGINASGLYKGKWLSPYVASELVRLTKMYSNSAYQNRKALYVQPV